MRAEFFKPEEADRIVGSATWDGSRVRVEAVDDGARGPLIRIFRATPIAVDDPALRPAGASGPVLLPPGSMAWFLAAARIRAQDEGLSLRLVPEARNSIGWDPAGAYRPFGESVERRERANRTREESSPV